MNKQAFLGELATVWIELWGMLLAVFGYLISKNCSQTENILFVFVPIVAVCAFSLSPTVFPAVN